MARTLSPIAHQSIIDAFVKLMVVRPIDEISTEAIARAAGSSKGTLYSHWKDKDELLIDVIGHILDSLPVANTGDFKRDAATVLRNMFAADNRNPYGHLLPHIFSYCITHPKFHRRMREFVVVRAPKHSLASILQDAIEGGELKAGLDVEYALDLLVGPLVHHRMMHSAVPPDLASRVVAMAWPHLAGTGPSRARPRPSAPHLSPGGRPEGAKRSRAGKPGRGIRRRQGKTP
jgi:AcrR family transcriptional regulator